MRTGIGFDIHRLVQDIQIQSIPIGGVAIPYSYKVISHSDGDVLVHAIIDACFGAAALGDIGQWFPDNDPKFANVSGIDLLKTTLEEIKKVGFGIYQIDSIVYCEEPKIAPHSLKIREVLASAMNIDLQFVSVKAKTMEGLGAIGNRQAIAAQAIVSLKEL